MNEGCPICRELASVETSAAGIKVTCIRCGDFALSEVVAASNHQLTQRQVANLSGWLREHPGSTIVTGQLDRLLELQSPTIGEKADRLLLHISQLVPKPGAVFTVGSGSSDLPIPLLIGVSWAQDLDELSFLLADYLIDELKLLSNVTGGGVFKITPKGWAYIHSLKQGLIRSETAFVAMWFNKTVDPAHTAIEAGIENAGYKAVRIDRHHHNNKIDDEIIAGIRRSKFLVADFTGQRGGVYFEAGFALGTGRPVIWLCRNDELKNVHFDNRQYNFILWEDGKLAELSKALQNRIEATIGRGPLAASA
ncbi:MAG: hypothetical protein IPK15_18130 [Verrucomicrobia bacterium]|nr:hypothetical protein [Verrucomicrobiota bacterium]